jgi:membrane protease YdiL (CAAX protease family)
MPAPTKYILITFFLILFAGAILLGPLLYFGLQPLFPIPFHRAMDRALLISSLAAMGFFWRRFDLRQFWPMKPGLWKDILLGYGLAAVSAQAMIGFDLALGGFVSSHLNAGAIAARILLALVAALFIPPLEETIFRGFLQGELVRGLGMRWGWPLAAFIYMLAHFLKIPPSLDQQPVHLWSGASALGAAFLPVVQGVFLCGRGLNLFLIGLILGGIYLRSGSLWVNLGLHSGWIFVLLLFTGITRPLVPANIPFFEGDLLSNLLTTLVLLLLSLWLWRFYQPRLPAPATGPNAP